MFAAYNQVLSVDVYTLQAPGGDYRPHDLLSRGSGVEARLGYAGSIENALNNGL